MKPKFTESTESCCLNVEYAHKYDISNLKKAWHFVVQLPHAPEVATFQVAAVGFPSITVKEIVNAGYYIIECEKCYTGRNAQVLVLSEQAMKFIQARKDGYFGSAVIHSNYKAPYLKDRWNKAA